MTETPAIRICINKMEKIITFKIKTRYYLELLMPETIQLLGSTNSKITKDENGENVTHFEITEEILVDCNVVNNNNSHLVNSMRMRCFTIFGIYGYSIHSFL